MNSSEQIKQFYLKHLEGAQPDGLQLKAPCPFCKPTENEPPGTMIVDLDPDSFFYGYFRCLNRCRPGGYAPHFGRLMHLDPKLVPGYDPDRTPYVRSIVFPSKN